MNIKTIAGQRQLQVHLALPHLASAPVLLRLTTSGFPTSRGFLGSGTLDS
jgi:hypothetical protein